MRKCKPDERAAACTAIERVLPGSRRSDTKSPNSAAYLELWHRASTHSKLTCVLMKRLSRPLTTGSALTKGVPDAIDPKSCKWLFSTCIIKRSTATTKGWRVEYLVRKQLQQGCILTMRIAIETVLHDIHIKCGMYLTAKHIQGLYSNNKNKC